MGIPELLELTGDIDVEEAPSIETIGNELTALPGEEVARLLLVDALGTLGVARMEVEDDGEDVVGATGVEEAGTEEAGEETGFELAGE
jgi:hypothetical protein